MVGDSRLPADFVDRLRDLLCTVQSERLMMRSQPDDDRLARIVSLAARQTGAELGLLLLVDEARGDLQVAATYGEALHDLGGKHLARTGVAGFAIDDGTPVAIANIARAGDVAGATQTTEATQKDEVDQRCAVQTRNLVAAPLMIHGVAAGALELRNSPEPKGFGPGDVELATELAYLAAAAVEEHRGERYLFSLFAAALPRALDPARGSGAQGLSEELAAWLAQLRQTPMWRRQLEMVADVRALCAEDADDTELVSTILSALVDRERRRRRFAGISDGVGE